jgi:hypothetical protein
MPAMNIFSIPIDRFPSEDALERFGNALVIALTAVSEMQPGAYVQAWPSGGVSVEIDNVSITSLARAVIASLKWQDAMTYRTASHVINEAEELLQTARFGLEDMQTRPARAKSGLRNVIVFGRAVTFALQNLRSVVPDFDAWYAPHQQAMRADPVMSYFSELRTKIKSRRSVYRLRTDWLSTRLTIRVFSAFILSLQTRLH